jgi:single-stranded-DNA-specific exonuclease
LCFKIILANNLTNINTETIGFYLGPFINAPGRMGNSEVAINLMTCDDDKEVMELCQQVMEYNANRKMIEKEIMNNIKNMSIDSKGIFFADKLHEGVIGIISGKLKEKHGKPTCIMSIISNELVKGSMRAPDTFNVGEFIKSAISKGLINYGGGHNCAGGFSTSLEKLPQLQGFLEDSIIKEYDPCIRVFSILSLHAIDDNFMKTLESFSPFGPSNEQPIFLLTNCQISDVQVFSSVSSNHMSLSVGNMFTKFKCFVFNVDSNPLYVIKDMSTAHIVGYPYIFRKKIHIKIIDIIPN